MNRREFLALSGLTLASSLLARCGSDAPSQSVQTPKAPERISVQDSLSDVLVSWSAVSRNIDGSPLADLAEYRIYRANIPSRPFQRIASVGSDALQWRDDSLRPGEIFYYKVKAVNARGAESDFSPESQAISLSIRVASEFLPAFGAALFLNRDGEIVPPSASRSDLTLTRFGEGFIALSRFCTHAGCSNMRFENQVWVCQCHGSQFSQLGRVLGAPAQTDLERYRATLQPDGSVVISFSHSPS